jgi:hypothetical protein
MDAQVFELIPDLVWYMLYLSPNFIYRATPHQEVHQAQPGPKQFVVSYDLVIIYLVIV